MSDIALSAQHQVRLTQRTYGVEVEVVSADPTWASNMFDKLTEKYKTTPGYDQRKKKGLSADKVKRLQAIKAALAAESTAATED